MAFFPKNFVDPNHFSSLPWREWHCLYAHSVVLKLEEIVCLIEHMYRSIPTMHSFEISGRSLFILQERHPEITPYLEKGNTLPQNYLINLRIKDDKGSYIHHPKVKEFEELFNQYGLPLLKRFIKNRFSRTSRRTRYDVYRNMCYFLIPFLHVITSWQLGPRTKPEQVGWLRLGEMNINPFDKDIAKLPITYASWQHVESIKNDYDLSIGYMEKMLEASDLQRQQFIWQIEKCFQTFPNLRRIVLRDPWSEFRNSLLSYGKPFTFKVETYYPYDDTAFQVEAILQAWAEMPHITDIPNIKKLCATQSVLPLMKRHATVIEGYDIHTRVGCYYELVNNIDPLYHRSFDKRFFLVL